MNNVFIYSLSDPRDNLIKYIGKSYNPEERLKTHICRNKNDKTQKNYWVQCLLSNNLKPLLEILDEVPESEWQFWEQHWISQIKAWGFNLKNGDNGGLGFDRYNEDVKKKISETLKGTETKRYTSYSQYSLGGVFIKKWESLKAIKEKYHLSKSSSNIPTSYLNHTTSLGFIWIKEGGDITDWIKKYSDKKALTKERSSAWAKTLALKYLKGNIPSLETKKKQSDARIGVAPSNKGVCMGIERILDMRKNTKSSRKVYQYDMNGNFIKEWSSIKFASDSLNIARAGIKNCCNGIFKHSGNFKWKFEELMKHEDFKLVIA